MGSGFGWCAAQWVYNRRSAKRSKDKPALMLSTLCSHCVAFEGTRSSPRLTHAVRVKETTGEDTSRSKRPPGGSDPQSAHIGRRSRTDLNKWENKGKDLWSAERLPITLFLHTHTHQRKKKNTTMLDGEMKNSRMLWKVEEIQKMESEGWPVRRKKNTSLLEENKKTREERGRGEETTFPQTPERHSPLIRIQLLPMSKCFHGSLWARHVVSALKSLCYSSSSNLPQNLLLRKRVAYT